MTWLLKLTIHFISEPMKLIKHTKAVWHEWSYVYGTKFNISRIVEVYEQLFKAK